MVIKYYQIYKHITFVGNNFNLDLPAEDFRHSFAILTGLIHDAFLNHNDAEIICLICESWASVGQLIIGLYCIAQRSRLAIIYPSITRDHPFKQRLNVDYMQETEKIQDWRNIAIIATRKWGFASTLLEQTVMMKKAIEDKRSCTNYQRNLLITNHRFYRLGALLPEHLFDAFDVDRILKSEMRTANNLSTFFDGSFNEVLARRAFPGIFIDQIKVSFNEIKN